MVEDPAPVVEEAAPAAELGAKISGTQLTAKTLTGGTTAPVVTTGRKYGEAEDLLYANALAAYTALKDNEPTKESLEAVYQSTIALAQALNIKVETRTDKGKDWHYEYEYTKNEIKVDFN